MNKITTDDKVGLSLQMILRAKHLKHLSDKQSRRSVDIENTMFDVEMDNFETDMEMLTHFGVKMENITVH